MLTKNEIYEVIEPALYLIISGLPNTNEALIITEQHLECVQSALEAYRKSRGNTASIDTVAIQEASNSRVQDIQTNASIGLSRLVNGFYFHQPENANAALAALNEHIIQDVYISPNQKAVDLLTKTLTKTP